jgi:hypothetical protein
MSPPPSITLRRRGREASGCQARGQQAGSLLVQALLLLQGRDMASAVVVVFTALLRWNDATSSAACLRYPSFPFLLLLLLTSTFEAPRGLAAAV